MTSLLSKVLSELEPIDKLAIRVSFEDWCIGVNGFFGVGFGKTGEERER
jgi:hypothetical protein